MLTTGPSTSPSLDRAGPQARPTRSSGKSSLALRLLDQLEADPRDACGVVGDEQDLVADGLDDAAAVLGDDLQRAGLELVDQVGQLGPAQRPALPGVVDDVGEPDAHRRRVVVHLARLGAVGVALVRIGSRSAECSSRAPTPRVCRRQT